MKSKLFGGEIGFRALWPWEEPQDTTKDQLFVVTRELWFESSRGRIVVPEGLLTDMASIPQAVHAYLDAKAKTILAPSIVHDYLYEKRGVLPDGRTFSRSEADDVLREGCLACGMRPAQAWVVRRMVGMFGGYRFAATEIGNDVAA